MTPQDRMLTLPRVPFDLDFSLMAKSASIFGIPAVDDYQPVAARRYAAYWVMMRYGRPMRTPMDFYFPTGPPRWNRPLLDLAATRYLVVDPDADRVADMLGTAVPLLQWVDSARGAHVYRNDGALPRARYVPRVEVVEDPDMLLSRLGSTPAMDPAVALVETPPRTGFTGVPGNRAPGVVTFERNDPEHLRMRVEAPASGFLLLADQYFPGWVATVNGADTAILRANYLFRLVEVPGGRSLVEFHYRPRSVRIGGAISLVAILAACAIVVGERRWVARHGRRLTPPAVP